MSGQPGLWDSHTRTESSTSQVKSERANESSLWDYPPPLPIPGVVDFAPGFTTSGNDRTLAHSSTSGIGSSTMNSAAPGPASGDGDVKGKGKAPAVNHDMPLLNSGGLPPLATAMAPFYSSDHHSEHFSVSGYDAGLVQSLGRGGTHALPGTSGLMSPFAPGHHPSGHQSSAQPGGWPRRELPPFFGPQNPGHDGPRCRCPVCSSSPQALCFQQQLAQQQAFINALWDDERTRLEACRSRVEGLVRQEGRIILDHYRQAWDEERNRLQYEIDALRKTIKGLEDGHLKLNDDYRKLWIENLKLQEDNVRLTDVLPKHRDVPGPAQGAVEGVALHHGNARPIFTDPFAAVASGQGDRPGAHNGGQGFRGSWTAWSDPTSASTSFGGRLRSSWPVQAPTRATSRSPPPLGMSAPQGPALAGMQSDRCMSMSPQPEYNGRIRSPSLSFCRSSPAPFIPDSPPSFGLDRPIPTRSPKRPLSVIDVNEVDAGLDGISLKADTVRKTTFAEVDSEGAPPSKRQRSLSQEYFIIDNMAADHEDEEEEEEEDGGRDKEEVRRLKMHAGHTPPTSPPLRHDIASRFSQGSPTPIAPCSPPQRKPAYFAEMEKAEALGSVSDDSGDVPLEGPLMMQNDPAEDESFLAALTEKLKPISQGLDALPRAAQSPSPVLAPLSPVRGERIGIRHPDADRAPRSEGSNPPSNEGEGSDKIRIYLGEPLDRERGPIIKIEKPSFPIKMEDIKPYDPDDDSSDDAKAAEPEVTIKFKSTSNFGAPFGRM